MAKKKQVAGPEGQPDGHVTFSAPQQVVISMLRAICWLVFLIVVVVLVIVGVEPTWLAPFTPRV